MLLVFLTSFSSFLIRTSNAVSVPNGQRNYVAATNGMTYANIGIILNSLDLSMRQVNFNMSVIFGFNFNASTNMTMQIWTSDALIGNVELINTTSGLNASTYQISPGTSSFNGYFRGGPEMYPFDHYEFNITLDLFAYDLQLFENTTIESTCVSMWPLRAQFNGPLDTFNSTTQTSYGIGVSITFGLNRPLWQGYATLLPIYLMFALIGSITLLKTDERDLILRLSVCLAVLTSALAYIFSIQSTLPPGRYYLSIPEALVYTVIGSLTIFIMFTLASYRFMARSINRIIMDAIAAIFSIAVLGFIFITFYTNSVVEIYSYSYNNILVAEVTIIPFLFLGLYLLAFQRIYDMVKRSRKREDLSGYFTNSYINSLSMGIYAIGYGLSIYLFIVAWYIQWSLGISFQSGVLSKLTGILVFVVFGIVVYVLKKETHRLRLSESFTFFVSDTVGNLIFMLTLGNLIFVLSPTANSTYMSILVYLIWGLLSLLFWLLRRNASAQPISKQLHNFVKSLVRTY
jgi:hypothetical protein